MTNELTNKLSIGQIEQQIYLQTEIQMDKRRYKTWLQADRQTELQLQTD